MGLSYFRSDHYKPNVGGFADQQTGRSLVKKLCTEYSIKEVNAKRLVDDFAREEGGSVSDDGVSVRNAVAFFSRERIAWLSTFSSLLRICEMEVLLWACCKSLLKPPFQGASIPGDRQGTCRKGFSFDFGHCPIG